MTNNTVEGCDYAFDLWNCSGLYAYHNNFITESGVFLEEYNSTCIWDNGYPSGGNYWSNYTGKDVRRGVDQDMLGSDGIGDTPYVFDENHQDNYPLMKPYSWDTHDVGVTSTTSTKTVVGQNLTAQVEVMTFNYGIHPETINMTVYANSTIIAEVRNIELQSRSYNLTSSYWNATSLSKGNYTIRTYITPVPAEEETEDNNFTKCWIIVSIVGDITGPDGWPNGKCDMRDVGLVANGFGANRVTNKTDPRYGQYWHSIPCGTCPHSPNCDVVYDGKIDMKDIGTVARHFGETDP